MEQLLTFDFKLSGIVLIDDSRQMPAVVLS